MHAYNIMQYEKNAHIIILYIFATATASLMFAQAVHMFMHGLARFPNVCIEKTTLDGPRAKRSKLANFKLEEEVMKPIK